VFSIYANNCFIIFATSATSYSKWDHCPTVWPTKLHYKKVTTRPEHCCLPHHTYNKTCINPILFNIHWLAVNHHTIFKILLITQKELRKLAPSYIHEMITSHNPLGQLHTLARHLLTLSYYNLKT